MLKPVTKNYYVTLSASQ